MRLARIADAALRSAASTPRSRNATRRRRSPAWGLGGPTPTVDKSPERAFPRAEPGRGSNRASRERLLPATRLDCEITAGVTATARNAQPAMALDAETRGTFN